MTARSRIDRRDKAANRCAEGSSWTELLIGAPKARHLHSLRPPWGPISFDPMAASRAASSREATVTPHRGGEAANLYYKMKSHTESFICNLVLLAARLRQTPKAVF